MNAGRVQTLMAQKNESLGFISGHEAYSKQQAMSRLGISQKFWDKMLDEGLPYSDIGHAKWVTGKDLIDYMTRTARQKNDTDQPSTEHDEEN